MIDSGIDLDHPDLNVDAGRSVSFLTTSTSADDAHGHGTHVAGTIGAKNNSVGVVGVAHGATLVSLRVLDASGSGPDSGVIAAVDHVAANASSGDVANLSLGTSFMKSMNDAITRAAFQDLDGDGVAEKSIAFVSAAGNSGTDASNYSPASAEGTNVYTVSAFDSRDAWARFSNWGSAIEYSEPGVDVRSTDRGGTYSLRSGTSMAAPHLAGILLLGSPRSDSVVKRDPDGDPDQIGER